MKKTILFTASLAVLLMTSCGGEKTEEKKEEKKEVTEETKSKFDALNTEWASIDGMVTAIDGALTSYDSAKMTTYLDSMSTVAEKAKKDVKEQAMPLIENLKTLNGQVAEWKTTFEGEKTTWQNITEDFTSVAMSINKGEASEDKVAPRVDGFTEQFNYKREVLGGILANWTKIETDKAALMALFAPAAK